MARNVVNLDALIPRQDMADPSDPSGANRLEKIDIHHLDDHFFLKALRKPDFQRETAHWSPEKVADLIRAFIDGDLIPAVILWQRGQNVFVIDGAHRLGALIAWVKDDFGDRRQSLEYFGGEIPDEQRRIAELKRKLVNSDIGPYVEYAAARNKPENAAEKIRSRLSNLAVNSIVAQWVPGVDEKAAEDSFFKINQAATPIDITERRILKARRSPNAVAARAIVRSGTGHKYWAHYAEDVQQQIEIMAKQIHKALYEPPMGEMPIKTIDLPVAGRGYNAMPFVFDLVNWANGITAPTRDKDVDKAPPEDRDGSRTLEFLMSVRDVMQLLTGTQPSSLGVHPVVYFYTRGGEFQPSAFLATAELIKKLGTRDQLGKFTQVRRQFEDFLLSHKEFITLTVKRTGSKHRSHPRLVRYLEFVLNAIADGKDDPETLEALRGNEELAFLAMSHGPVPMGGTNPSGQFSRRTKSASFLNTAIESAVRCGLCGAMVHRNSISIDHIQAKSQGGGSDMRNAQVTHPYCNSIKGSGPAGA